jgi:ribosomal protein S18 acetylase RimI-like enzyme
MEIHALTDERLDQMISYIARHNATNENHIGFYGDGETDIRESLSEFVHPLTESFLLASEGAEIIGVFGVDYDPEVDRAWLYGPLVTVPDWHTVADVLYDEARKLIPPDIHSYDLFFDMQNSRGDVFAERHGFPLRSENALLVLHRGDYKRNNQPGEKVQVIDFQTAFFDQFDALHNHLFPNTYRTSRQIVEKLDDTQRLFIAIESEKLLGYHFCKMETESGYVDFIGVDSSARGRRIGATLLVSGLDWMLSAVSTNKINLNVFADNLPARRLYEKFGFVTERVMRGYRKQLP